MDKVLMQELAERNDDAQFLADIARLDAILKKGVVTKITK
mgnify:CR=1 FL=1